MLRIILSLLYPSTWRNVSMRSDRRGALAAVASITLLLLAHELGAAAVQGIWAYAIGGDLSMIWGMRIAVFVFSVIAVRVMWGEPAPEALSPESDRDLA